mmetsp:Transcript_38469/g.50707  ORF Transcript_38469/g.50707 Transcript_38469/m.50707 type:complete len:247 (-) Transcript_38469:317-1057(-)
MSSLHCRRCGFFCPWKSSLSIAPRPCGGSFGCLWRCPSSPSSPRCFPKPFIGGGRPSASSTSCSSPQSCTLPLNSRAFSSSSFCLSLSSTSGGIPSLSLRTALLPSGCLADAATFLFFSCANGPWKASGSLGLRSALRSDFSLTLLLRSSSAFSPIGPGICGSNLGGLALCSSWPPLGLISSFPSCWSPLGGEGRRFFLCGASSGAGSSKFMMLFSLVVSRSKCSFSSILSFSSFPFSSFPPFCSK